MARYGRGDAAAFEVLYRRHEMRVWRYLERNLRNRATADELMQEVWFAVAREATRYEPSARFTTWLFTIAHHRMIDSIRKSRRQTSLDSLGHESELVVEQLTAEPAPDRTPRRWREIRPKRSSRQSRHCRPNSAKPSCCKSKAT